MSARWDFQQRILGRSNTSGDITRLFNTGDSRPPRSFSKLLDRADESSISAAIYGREGIANCVDASMARRDGSGRFALEISFDELNRSGANSPWEILDLATLAKRANEPGVARNDLGLGSNDCLSEGPDSSIRIMVVHERRGGGMPGGLNDPQSFLARALLNVGEAQTLEGSAGSYGYGKAAVAQASRIRVVLAYTCTPPTETDPVTRRLLGVAYWGMHDHQDQRYTGWALFGTDSDEQRTDALVEEAADEVIERLGIPTRDAGVVDDLGTTFVIVDPLFDAHKLRGAIELFWWPLLQQSRTTEFDLTIRTENGDVLRPAVDETHPELGQFVTSFRRAEDARNTRSDLLAETITTQVGEAGVTSIERRADGSPIETSLIAKMRSPLMVVNYDSAPSANPPVVGVFVAHDATNEHLRSVEPPEHDKWLARNVGGLNATSEDLRFSRLVRQEVDAAVNALRAPDPPPVHGISAFSKFFPAVDVKAVRPRSPRPKGKRAQRLVCVHLVHDQGDELVEVDRPSRHVKSDGTLSASAEVRFFLDRERAARVSRQHLDATITIGARIAEDRAGRVDWWPASVTQRIRTDEGVFVRTSEEGVAPAVFEGRFHLDENIHFVIETESYQPDWTIEMTFNCDPWDVVEPTVPATGAEAD